MLNAVNPSTCCILAIESSCDETAIAIYQNGLLAHTLNSQIALHQAYGGVVPELASRDHLTHIHTLIQQALVQANKTLNQVDVFAYTKGPGLGGCLLVGASVAKTLAMYFNKPSLAVHHLEGHLLSPFLSEPDLQFPFLALLVSGGHTQIIEVRHIYDYTILGDTLDDACGEAFDKTAKMLGMPYPGGKYVSDAALQGKAIYPLPKPLMHSGDLNMSFAGLKTAVRQLIMKLKLENQQNNPNNELFPEQIADICASFIESATGVLAHKLKQALQQTHLKQVVVVGGVGANLQLRNRINQLGQSLQAKVFYPSLEWCTDNAAMIAITADLYIQYQQAKFDDTTAIDVLPRCALAFKAK